MDLLFQRKEKKKILSSASEAMDSNALAKVSTDGNADGKFEMSLTNKDSSSKQ